MKQEQKKNNVNLIVTTISKERRRDVTRKEGRRDVTTAEITEERRRDGTTIQATFFRDLDASTEMSLEEVKLPSFRKYADIC
ncbi:unnamed protein product [Brassica napus]|uniref:(rape) hypothetical protein n=1 Tax=Brassica napus TaxID=3708 RepID=A0A816KY26_BRANA|nr:unnamed protein product [Brassica napus]